MLHFVLESTIYESLNCDWLHFEPLIRAAKNNIENSISFLPAATSLYLLDSPALQNKIAKYWVENNYIPEAYISHTLNHKKIKIGYFSPDFKDHPLTTLLGKVFELRDRDIFETYAFNLSPPVEDISQKKLRANFDFFLDVSSLSDTDLKSLILSKEIDIAVNLIGFFGDYSRPNIFATRCAPIQISYMYASTMSMPTMDYIIADSVTTPLEFSDNFAEKIIQLPGSFYSLSPLEYEENFLSKDELGIPSDKFVFCCFNMPYKINPFIFKLWNEILASCPDSILILREISKAVSANIKKFAIEYGYSADRIIFINSSNKSVYYSLLKECDLFIDTYPYGAHTVAIEAAYWGLPILTLQGKNFASRVASSILINLECEQLITYKTDEFIKKAVYFYNNRDVLLKIRESLLLKRNTSEIYDCQRFTKNLEKSYLATYNQKLLNLPSDHILI